MIGPSVRGKLSNFGRGQSPRPASGPPPLRLKRGAFKKVDYFNIKDFKALLVFSSKKGVGILAFGTQTLPVSVLGIPLGNLYHNGYFTLLSKTNRWILSF